MKKKRWEGGEYASGGFEEKVTSKVIVLEVVLGGK